MEKCEKCGKNKMYVCSDGTIKKVSSKKISDAKTIVEEERLYAIEEQVKNYVQTQNLQQHERRAASDWWFSLSDVEKITIWKNNQTPPEHPLSSYVANDQNNQTDVYLFLYYER